MSQRRTPHNGDLSSAPDSNVTSASQNDPSLTTANYGTIKSNDIPFTESSGFTRPTLAKALSSPAETAPATATATTTTTTIEPPKPAVRRKIQRQEATFSSSSPFSSLGPDQSTTVFTLPSQVRPSSDKMLARNGNNIQAIDQQRSSLTTAGATRDAGAVDKKDESLPELSSSTKNNPMLALHNRQQRAPSSDQQSNEDDLKQQQLSLLANGPTRPYPKKVFFIIANEFCERFSYYGLRTVLVLYFRSVLGLSDSGSTVSFHLFATLCYLTPILGAILGDSILGKYKTILYLSIVYFLGELTLVVSSIFWDLSTTSVLITWLGLLLIGIGTGGIKPCVAAFAGDQFHDNETKWRESFFSLFYGAINLGSLISMFITPLLRSNYGCVGRSDCYPYAFGLPCLLIFIATIVFLLAHNHYYIAPLPDQNVILAFCECTWLALKRKMSGCTLPSDNRDGLMGQTNYSLSQTPTPTSSNLSLASSEHENKPVAPNAKSTQLNSTLNMDNKAGTGAGQLVAMKMGRNESEERLDSGANNQQLNKSNSGGKRNHWLYLASDRFDKNSIEEFRCVLGILLLFLPTPVYWCLFDQQGSLWTLQATRMDGRLFNSRYVLEADQMTVANPILLLASIPLFQLVIYPSLGKCNLLTTPIQRMTAGGFIAALSFVASALIEFQVQANTPQVLPSPGYANLLLVNGLSECSITEPTISFNDPVDMMGQFLVANSNQSNLAAAQAKSLHDLALASRSIGSLEPLGTRRISSLPVANLGANLSNSSSLPASYKLSFKLATSSTQQVPLLSGGNSNNNSQQSTPNSVGGCPFDSKLVNELNIGSLADRSVRLMYIEQGNGKLTYKLFNESLALPPAGKARVRLLYEFFGSYSSAQKRQFYLVPKNAGGKDKKQQQALQFNMTIRDGQVLLSDYIDVNISPNSDTFTLYTNDSFLNIFPSTTAPANTIPLSQNSSSPFGPQQQQQQQPQAQTVTIKLEPGTRNLLLLHQVNAMNAQVKQELLQDNNYRISILYQLVPYTMISMSEVMFSITGLEFSYAMAPPNLKSLILGAWSLTTAVGNILTVAVESFHPFSNIAHDFLFYAALMALDMLLFAVLGYYYEPYHPYRSGSQSKAKN